ncbi:MAG TPA: ribonuclease H-like domain-containing protein [Armatimonadota bacterium]|jgi:hypothetical protein
MLKRTFVHLPKIGYGTERKLWRLGVRDWESALDLDSPPSGFSLVRWDEVRDHVEDSLHSLQRHDHRYFALNLAPADHWRALSDFSNHIGFLDIETTGTGYGSEITVVGLWDGHLMRTYVAGDNLGDFPEDLEQFALLVTFNGASFDLPFLRRHFRGLPRNLLHVDLCHALHRLGLRGGLKVIERRLGLARDDDLDGLSGEDAVYLWHEYLAGSPRALDLLVRYNAADVQNLETLLAWAYPRLWEHVGGTADAEADA